MKATAWRSWRVRLFRCPFSAQKCWLYPLAADEERPDPSVALVTGRAGRLRQQAFLLVQAGSVKRYERQIVTVEPAMPLQAFARNGNDRSNKWFAPTGASKCLRSRALSVFWSLLLGGLVGWIGSLVMRTDTSEGIFLDIVAGAIGAVAAALLLAESTFDSLMAGCLGSLSALTLLQAIRRAERRRGRP